MVNNSKRTTIQDIARHAEVSITTVSRVLNANGYVSEDKRQTVLAAIKELDYRPNIFAQSLASGQSRTIGVLTQLIASPLYDQILRGVVENLDNSGYSPLIADGYWNPRREKESVQTFLDRSVDGLILLGGSMPHEDIIAISKKIPTFIIARNIPELGCQSIPVDDFKGAYLATQHLIEAGHRRIAHFRGLMEHADATRRWNGYRQALKDAGLAEDPNLLVQGDFLESSGVLGVEMLLTRGVSFSAIFTANDQMAFGARLALHRRGIRVPDDVSLVGFDDVSVSAFMTPPLTTISVPAQEIGGLAAQGMLALIRDEPCQISVPPLKLMVRESVARR
jgi:LacI family transcriptional regulator